MKKYRLMISKGIHAVAWNDDIFVEAKDKEEAEKIALDMSKNGKIDLGPYDLDDSNALYQVEWCEEGL